MKFHELSLYFTAIENHKSFWWNFLYFFPFNIWWKLTVTTIAAIS